ncbi:hypothetical protein E2562_033834 [Oryza meyeriana var. granulata]|uniref:Uncharacterized protein n=1 Tax=Oryza meyeriana var. granulata TaxID=110450 RepID=A0A6G1F188_9ORYZ|nr:hypothetical protein E2562_033834 [Oryza meyeriana var. granulata]
MDRDETGGTDEAMSIAETSSSCRGKPRTQAAANFPKDGMASRLGTDAGDHSIPPWTERRADDRGCWRSFFGSSGHSCGGDFGSSGGCGGGNGGVCGEEGRNLTHVVS